MIIEMLNKYWKFIFDFLIITLVIVLIIIPWLIKLYLFIRTKYFWEPRLGDIVLKHAFRKNTGTIIRVDGDDFLVESDSGYASSRSWWNKENVTFLRRES